mmetsp:Transcript_21357/g.37814  ORF Transcript_21357/g.37814 Transcript_21357/m.37814 type:complete len:407 (+) Transcript_21357:1-1221(+)
MIGFLFPDFSYTWLTPEFERNMELELDFKQEGHNSERLARMFKHRRDVYVPKIHWEHTSARLLVMEYVDCLKINDVPAIEKSGINPLELAETVSNVFGDMIHVHGFVHVDPHPGNLGVIAVEPTFLESMWARVSTLGYIAMVPLMLSVAVFAAPGSTVALAGAGSAIGLTTVAGISAVVAPDSRDSSAQEAGKRYKLVVFDHGMYRRLDPSFRAAYCKLWKSLLFRDNVQGRIAVRGLGVPDDFYEILATMFTMRTGKPATPEEEKLHKADRKRAREQFKDVTAKDVNEFLQRLPRDLLFVMRCTNIVRGINATLGGDIRMRFRVMGQSAVRGLLVRNPEPQEYVSLMDPKQSYEGRNEVNLPVASEVVDTEKLSWRQMFEMWQLKFFLQVIDTSWGILGVLVRLL